jgi:hypothetical protein
MLVRGVAVSYRHTLVVDDLDRVAVALVRRRCVGHPTNPPRSPTLTNVTVPEIGRDRIHRPPTRQSPAKSPQTFPHMLAAAVQYSDVYCCRATRVRRRPVGPLAATRASHTENGSETSLGQPTGNQRIGKVHR